MQPRFTLILGMLGFAAALVAAPVGVQDNIASLHEKAAYAAGNGHGGGNGHGRGHGGGQGLGEGVSASADGPGNSDSAPGQGGAGHGQAVGHDAVSGVSHSAHHNGVAASATGNLNAANAAPQAFKNSAPNSMVGAIREAVQKSYVDSSDEDTVIDRNEDDTTKKDEISLEDLERALAEISNKDVNPDVAGAVAGMVDGKVSEPDSEAP